MPRLVSRIHLSLVALAQARATALATNGDPALVGGMDTAIAQLRANMARLEGGSEALAALDAGDALLPPLNTDDLNNNNDADA